MDEHVTSNNFYLGCRVCRILLVKSSSIFFQDQIPEMEGVCYSDAFVECTNVEIDQNDGFPQRLCSDCAAKLTIAYQFRKDAIESDKILKSYSENEKNESEMYEDDKFQEEIFEYETLEELDDEYSMDHEVKQENTSSELAQDCGNDAVSFLTGILKKTPKSGKRVMEVKKVKHKPPTPADCTIDDATRRHVCNVCNKRFQKRSNLIDHLRLHANVKVFACDYCDKSFVQAGNFKAHLRTHTKEKPYVCTFCSKSYSQSSSLKIHIRSHTQEKNYICETCDKGFTNASDLGKHKLIHDPVKRFRCEECHRNFTQKVHLRKHFEKHHSSSLGDFDAIFKSGSKNNSKIILEECYVDDDEDSKDISVVVKTE